MEGRLLIDVIAARGLRDTQIFGTQDPYVVYTLLPDDGTTARSKHVPSGGTAPVFSPHHGALMSLPLTRSHAVLRVEVWNSNTFVDERIGGVDLELYKPYWEYGAGSQFEAALDTGGTLQMVLERSVRGVDVSEGEGGGAHDTAAHVAESASIGGSRQHSDPSHITIEVHQAKLAQKQKAAASPGGWTAAVGSWRMHEYRLWAQAVPAITARVSEGAGGSTYGGALAAALTNSHCDPHRLHYGPVA